MFVYDVFFRDYVVVDKKKATDIVLTVAYCR
jgi:hypothetical protein